MDNNALLPPHMGGRFWHQAGNLPMRAAHRHTELEVNLVREGTAAYLLGERRYDLRRGTLTWLFPAQDHILLEQSPGYQVWVGIFSPALVQHVCTSPATQTLLHPDPPGRFCRCLSEGDAAWLEMLLGRVSAEAEHGDAALQQAALSHALLSAWHLWEVAEDVPAGTEVHPAVEHAARLIRDETDPLSVEQLAGRVGLSAPRLSLLFKQQTGMALAEFRNRQRLERFLRGYGRGRSRTLLDAALEAGWGSYAQFHRVFTSLMGYGPAEYHRRVQEEGSAGK